MPASFPTLLVEKTTAGLRERERPHEGVLPERSAQHRCRLKGSARPRLQIHGLCRRYPAKRLARLYGDMVAAERASALRRRPAGAAVTGRVLRRRQGRRRHLAASSQRPSAPAAWIGRQLCLTPKRSWAIAPGSATWRVPSSPTVPPGAPVAGCASRIGDAVPIGWLNNSGAMRLPGASVKCCWRRGRARRFQAPALHRLAASRSATLPSG